MDIAVLADVHGNYIALERCLEFALSHNIRTFFFLGDYIGELAYPERTMQILYDVNDRYKCYFIKGNKEDYWLKYRISVKMAGRIKIPPAVHYYIHTTRSHPEIWISLHSCSQYVR